jgi:hypothetical protein
MPASIARMQDCGCCCTAAATAPLHSPVERPPARAYTAEQHDRPRPACYAVVVSLTCSKATNMGKLLHLADCDRTTPAQISSQQHTIIQYFVVCDGDPIMGCKQAWLWGGPIIHYILSTCSSKHQRYSLCTGVITQTHRLETAAAQSCQTGASFLLTSRPLSAYTLCCCCCCQPA